MDLSDDDFFISGSSSDEAHADDEMTDISARCLCPFSCISFYVNKELPMLFLWISRTM